MKKFVFALVCFLAFGAAFAAKPKPVFNGENATVFESIDFTTDFMILTAVNKTTEKIDLDIYAYDEANSLWVKFASAKVEDYNDTDNFMKVLKYKIRGWKYFRYYAVQAKNVSAPVVFSFKSDSTFVKINVAYEKPLLPISELSVSLLQTEELYGYGVNYSFRNTSGRTIKTCTVSVVPLNGSGQEVADANTGNSKINVKNAGDVQDGVLYKSVSNVLWHNKDISSVKLLKAKIEYEDGSEYEWNL